MSDIGAAAPVADAPAQPLPDTDVVAPPAELKDAPQQEAKEPEPKKPLSARDSLTKAAEKVAAKEKAEADPKALKTDPKAKPADDAETDKNAKAEQPRDKGRFAPKADADKDAADAEAAKGDRAADRGNADPERDDRAAPKRFSAAARAAWDSLPPEHDELRRETHRAFRELEAGIEKHRPQSQRYREVYEPFDRLAHESKIDPVATLKGYVEVDRKISNPQTFLEGVGDILRAKGVEPIQYAQAIIADHNRRNGQPPANGQPPQQQAPRGPSPADIDRIVQQRVQQLVAPIQQRFSEQETASNEQTLEEWAADKPHFQTLRGRVTQLVAEDGLSPDDAYAKAVIEAQEIARGFLGESGSKSPSSRPAPGAEDADEQIVKGTKSLKGAPSPGSAPGAQKPSPTVRAALERAMKKAL